MRTLTQQRKDVLDITKTIRDQLPLRWAETLSQGVVSQMALELGFLRTTRAGRFMPTERGIQFGVKRFVPRGG